MIPDNSQPNENLQEERIIAFHENGIVFYSAVGEVTNRLRCKMSFRGQSPAVYGYSPICGTAPVGDVDLILGVSPDPTAPVVVRWLEVNDRTPQEPGPLNGFEVLGTEPGNQGVRILKRNYRNDYWRAELRTMPNGSKIWQADKVAPVPEFVPIPTPPPERDGSTLGIVKTWFTTLIENFDLNARIAVAVLGGSIIGLIIWRFSRNKQK